MTAFLINISTKIQRWFGRGSLAKMMFGPLCSTKICCLRDFFSLRDQVVESEQERHIGKSNNNYLCKGCFLKVEASYKAPLRLPKTPFGNPWIIICCFYVSKTESPPPPKKEKRYDVSVKHYTPKSGPLTGQRILWKGPQLPYQDEINTEKDQQKDSKSTFRVLAGCIIVFSYSWCYSSVCLLDVGLIFGLVAQAPTNTVLKDFNTTVKKKQRMASNPN